MTSKYYLSNDPIIDNSRENNNSKNLNGCEVFCVRYSEDNQFIAAGYGDSSIKIYNSATGKSIFQLNGTAVNPKQSKSPVTCMRFRPNVPAHKTKNVLLAVYGEGIIQHWHVTSNKLLNTIIEEGNEINCVDYRRDASKFATAGKDATIRIYDEGSKICENTISGGQTGVTAGHSNRIFALKFHPENPNIIISGGWDNTIQISDIRVQQSIRSIYGPHICGDAIDINGDEILTGSWRTDNPLQIYDFGTGKLKCNIPWNQSSQPQQGEVSLLYSAQFSKNTIYGGGELLIAAGGTGSNEVKVFEKSNNNNNNNSSSRISNSSIGYASSHREIKDRDRGGGGGATSSSSSSLNLVGGVKMPSSVYCLDFDYEGKNIAIANSNNGVEIIQIHPNFRNVSGNDQS